ncbi:MAG: metallophosphoesterase family protein [Candidatus Omnitrophota bacterium]|nr:metallophosphatase family protein [Candidatus Omnitrophota bacterium]
MKIGVISDTHIPVNASKLPKKVYDHFRQCDLIVHAGDVVEESLITELETLAETKAVQGNMDSLGIKKRFPKKILFKAGGKSIGVIHGSGHPLKVMDVVAAEFSPKPDIIIFGHSHLPVNEMRKGVLFFNPGSATDGSCSKGCSFGTIEIDGDDMKAEIIGC